MPLNLITHGVVSVASGSRLVMVPEASGIVVSNCQIDVVPPDPLYITSKDPSPVYNEGVLSVVASYV